jgi:hypothetical protein
VTAYRLVMGQYPPPLDARQNEHGAWQVRSPDVRPLLESNPRIESVLREVMVRLLSEASEERGTAAQVAEALEAGAGGAEHPKPSKPPVRAWAWKPCLALTAAGSCAVLLWYAKPVLVPPGSSSQTPDVGTTAVGGTSPPEPQAFTAAGTEKKPPAQEPLPEPRPGQIRPDKKGQCPVRQQIPINGGCWIDVNSLADAQACAGSGYVFFQGRCFVPALESPRKPHRAHRKRAERPRASPGASSVPAHEAGADQSVPASEPDSKGRKPADGYCRLVGTGA